MSATSVFGSSESDAEDKIKTMNRAAGARMLAVGGQDQKKLDLSGNSLFKGNAFQSHQEGPKNKDRLYQAYGLSV